MAQCGICEEKEGVREAGVYMDGEKKAVPVCSYAAAWFEKHPEYADVLAEA